jgi:hypothetical protein
MPDPNPYESPRAITSVQEIDERHERPDSVKPLEPYGVLAFVLALFIPLSGLGGILAVLVAQQRITQAAMVTVLADILIVIPTIVSWRRHRKAPDRWRGYGFLVGAMTILASQVTYSVFVFLWLIQR